MASKKVKKNKDAPLVRVEPETYEKVKGYIKKSKQSIGGFYTLAAEEKLQSVKKH